MRNINSMLSAQLPIMRFSDLNQSGTYHRKSEYFLLWQNHQSTLSGTRKKHRVWNEKLSFFIGRFAMLSTL